MNIEDIKNWIEKNSIANELNENELTYQNAIDLIRKRNKKNKTEFLNDNIIPLGKSPTEDETHNYFVLLLPLVRGLYLSIDQEVLTKLKPLRIKDSIKWFLSFEEFIEELDRISQIEGLRFDPLEVLKLCVCYTDQMIIKSLQSELGYVQTYNKVSETSTSSILIKNSIRRKKSNLEKNQKGKLNEVDNALDELLFNRIADYVGEADAISLISKCLISNKNMLLEFLASEFIQNGPIIGKKHIELFPLLKLICKNHQLFSRTEYFNDKILKDEGDKKCDILYNNYMIRRVKNILYKK